MKDPYINEKGVLINKLNIDDYDELRKAEADIGFLKLIDIDKIDSTYYDEELLKSIHRHIFGDIFDWAREYRRVPLFKEEVVLPRYSIPYADPQDIEQQLHKKLEELNRISWDGMSQEEIAATFVRKMALLWRVHPFRDGNTRTMLCFSYLYAKSHGFPLDIETFADNLDRRYNHSGVIQKYSIRDKFVLACLDEKDYPEPEALTSIYLEAMSNYAPKDDEIIRRK